jgi:hypothetical protein
MSITVYADVIAPNNLFSAGVRGKNIRTNTRVQMGGGEMQINTINPLTLRQYTLGTVPLRVEQWRTLEGLYEVTDAGAYGFLIEDPKDCLADYSYAFLQAYTTLNVGALGTGYGVPVHHLYKRYTSAGSTRYRDRRITRPGAIVIKRGAAPVTIGVAAGNAALDSTTGTVTFVADISQALTGITPGATTVLTFASGTPVVAGFTIGERVYLTGVTGTAAAALNNLSHAITAKGATSLTVSTVTTGLSATLFGTAYKYPQASEALTWSGRHYVPVHFESDEIEWELTIAGPADSRMMSGPNVMLTEVKE